MERHFYNLVFLFCQGVLQYCFPWYKFPFGHSADVFWIINCGFIKKYTLPVLNYFFQIVSLPQNSNSMLSQTMLSTNTNCHPDPDRKQCQCHYGYTYYYIISVFFLYMSLPRIVCHLMSCQDYYCKSTTVQ